VWCGVPAAGNGFWTHLNFAKVELIPKCELSKFELDKLMNMFTIYNLTNY